MAQPISASPCASRCCPPSPGSRWSPAPAGRRDWLWRGCCWPSRRLAAGLRPVRRGSHGRRPAARRRSRPRPVARRRGSALAPPPWPAGWLPPVPDRGGPGRVYDQLSPGAGRARLLDAAVPAGLRRADAHCGPRARPPDDAKDLLGYYVPLLVVGRAGGGPGCRGRTSARSAAAGRRRRLPRGRGRLPLLARATSSTPAGRVALARRCPCASSSCAIAGRASDRAGRERRPGAGPGDRHGLLNRASALVRTPTWAPLDLAVADGVRAPPVEARALPRSWPRCRARAGGRADYATAGARLGGFNNPLLYVLAERHNVLTATSACSPAGRPAPDRGRAAAQAAAGVVRWADPCTLARAQRGRAPQRLAHPRPLPVRRYRVLQRAGPTRSWSPVPDRAGVTVTHDSRPELEGLLERRRPTCPKPS